jgi:HEAT repeat protein
MLAERYSLPNLIKTVREEADDSKVLIALKHIRSKHPGEEAEKVYTSLIDDNQLPIRKRAFAINALGELKTPSAEDKLKKIAADKSNRLLALTAIGALSKCGDEEIIEFLKDLSNKSDSPEIRRKCAWSIKQIEASLQGR